MATTSEATHYQHYELLRRADGSLWKLGRGAMGITYKAYDANLHCTVALKVINTAHLDGDAAQQRFLREARAAAALRHPNVASVFNLGTDQGHCFYVMEFVDGETVEAHVSRHGPLPPAEALRFALQVARALAAAAKKQLVHRDLKPANLMLIDQDGEPVVKVIDFGLAKGVAGQSDESSRLTIGGEFVGTPYFASPEQVEGGRSGHPLGPLFAGGHALLSADGPATLFGLGGPGHEQAFVQAGADRATGRGARRRGHVGPASDGKGPAATAANGAGRPGGPLRMPGAGLWPCDGLGAGLGPRKAP